VRLRHRGDATGIERSPGRPRPQRAPCACLPRLTADAAVVVDDGAGARAGVAALQASLPESSLVGRYTAPAYVPPPGATMTAVVS
jgi:hypothetical protein